MHTQFPVVFASAVSSILDVIADALHSGLNAAASVVPRRCGRTGTIAATAGSRSNFARSSWTAFARRTVGLGIVLALMPCAASTARAGIVTSSILSVNLTNPVLTAGNGLSEIRFSLFSKGIGRQANLGTSPAGISVTSNINGMRGPDRYAGIGGTQAGLNVSFVGQDVVNITLTPLRVYRPGENVRFTLTVSGSNSVRIISAMGGSPPAWFDNSGPPPAKLTPGPALPGFAVNPRDAQYTAYNDLESSFGIQNLSYLPNITQSDFDAIDLDAVLVQPSNLAGITLPPGGIFDQVNLPDPDLGNLFAATGQLVDPTDNRVLGSFKEAVVLAGVPEPGSISLALIGLASLGSRQMIKSARVRALMARSRVTEPVRGTP